MAAIRHEIRAYPERNRIPVTVDEMSALPCSSNGTRLRQVHVCYPIWEFTRATYLLLHRSATRLGSDGGSKDCQHEVTTYRTLVRLRGEQARSQAVKSLYIPSVVDSE